MYSYANLEMSCPRADVIISSRVLRSLDVGPSTDVTHFICTVSILLSCCSLTATAHSCTYCVANSGVVGRQRCRWEDNIEIDLQEEGCADMDWIELAQDRDRWRALVDAVMNLRAHKVRGIY